MLKVYYIGVGGGGGGGGGGSGGGEIQTYSSENQLCDIVISIQDKY
jgi:hypothetical protein